MPSSAFSTSSATPSASTEPHAGERAGAAPRSSSRVAEAPLHDAAAAGAVEGRGAVSLPSHGAELRRAIEILQEKWVLHIVHALLGRPSGFNELGRAVGGCNPSTLAQRLQRLEALGLLRKEAEAPPERSGRGRYALTPAGESLRPVIDAIGGWAADHLATERADN